MLKNKLSNIVLDTRSISWKKRPSEIRGYQRTFYANTQNGDYVRVDYNLKEKRVRLYVEVDNEGGNAYYTVITNGKISLERSVSSGRTFGFAEKFHSRADVFSSIPNREVLKLINRNYGIKRGKLIVEEEPKTEKEKLIQETKKRYFRKELYDEASKEAVEGRKLFRKIRLFDLFDILIGILLSSGMFMYFKYSYMAMGMTAAFFGIIIGFYDMFFRNRSPMFIKVVFFVFAGAASYIYGYFF